MDTFELMAKGFDLAGYQHVPLTCTWNIKFDGRGRACLVTKRKVAIGSSEEDVWSRIGNKESIHTTVILAMFNKMKILTADISSVYLIAETTELIYIRIGPEFGQWKGRLAIIQKVL
eukprot:10834402-Ditylum_brightwellii.AAC.1